MYKKRKLRSHFVSHLYAVMHDARLSLFYLCGLVCGLAELVVCSRAVCVTLVCRYLSCGLVCGLAVRF